MLLNLENIFSSDYYLKLAIKLISGNNVETGKPPETIGLIILAANDVYILVFNNKLIAKA